LTTPLLPRLNTYSKLSQADTHALESLSRSPLQEVSPRRDVIREGENPTHVRLVLEGWACRYKTTREGQRQIVGFLIPGDFCDPNVLVLRHMDHSIGAITRVRVAQIAPERVGEVTAEHPRIAQAFWWHELVNASIQREWLLNLGQRSAYERLGHLLVEIFFRMRTVGLADSDSCEFPLTQNDLADATGLTSVHVNRTLQDLRRQGLVELDRKRLRLPNLQAVMNASGFNPNYLHLDDEGRPLDADD
jgi:CRP-like cAMP-binding protein